MNKAIIAKLTGVSYRHVFYVAAGRYYNDDVKQLLSVSDEDFIQRWLGSEYLRAACLLAHSRARNAKVRYFAMSLLKFSETLSEQLSEGMIRKCWRFLASKQIENICDTAIVHARDNELKYYLTDLYTINKHLRGEETE